MRNDHYPLVGEVRDKQLEYKACLFMYCCGYIYCRFVQTHGKYTTKYKAYCILQAGALVMSSVVQIVINVPLWCGVPILREVKKVVAVWYSRTFNVLCSFYCGLKSPLKSN